MYSLDYELSNQSYKYRWTVSFTISTHPDKTSMADDCVFCTCNVRPRQEALCCNECGRWQHRTCETGISRAEYRALVKTKEDFAFVCSTCKSNTAEVLQSTAMETSTTPTRLVIPPMEITQVETETETETYRPPEMLDSFDIPHRHAADEDEEPMEEALETTENETFVQDEAVAYDILEKGSKRGCPLLVSSDGFTYNLKKQTKDSTIWRCTPATSGMFSTLCRKEDHPTSRTYWDTSRISGWKMMSFQSGPGVCSSLLFVPIMTWKVGTDA